MPGKDGRALRAARNIAPSTPPISSLPSDSQELSK
jgi:hypothetical protein